MKKLIKEPVDEAQEELKALRRIKEIAMNRLTLVTCVDCGETNEKGYVCTNCGWGGNKEPEEEESLDDLKAKVKEENLHIIDTFDPDFDREYLDDLLEWQENYSDEMSWEEFDATYMKCSICGSYELYADGGCLCYTR